MTSHPTKPAGGLDIDPAREAVAPRPAATVVLLRDGTRGLEAFLVRRTPGAAFMAGAHVFPGGKLDENDAADVLRARTRGIDDATAVRLGDAADAGLAFGLHVAAIRETFEESGVWLGGAECEVDLPAARAQLLGGASLSEVVGTHGLWLDGGALVPYARWVTPAVEKRRFDARFFLARAPRDSVASHDEVETVAGAWVTADDAVRAHHDARIDLPPPTLRTLESLAQFSTVDAALDDARRRLPPLVRPVFLDDGGRWVLALPGDPAHPEPTPVIAGATRFTLVDGRFISGHG